MPTENNRIWTPGEIITASKLNYIENFLTNISTDFVSTQGSTISGDIIYKKTNVDLMQTNNGVTNKLYPAIAIFQDNNEKSFARVEGAVWSDNEEEDFKGSTWVTIWARNYKTSDKTEVTNALRLGVNKNGKLLVKLTDEEKEAWRDALGIISDDYMTIDNAILQQTGSTTAQTVRTPLTTTYYFGGTTSGGPWAEGKDKALLRNFASSSNDVFIPTVSMLSPNGSWTIGTYRDNSLRFVYYNNSNSYSYAISANGVFSGTAAAANQLTTAPTLTIGSTGKTFNGTANVSWSLSEIGAAAATHYHSAGHITSGTLPVVRGGTGAGSPSAARANLEAAALNHKHTMNDLTGTLSIEKGGTGATSASAARTALGITPANIGAATASHIHSNYVEKDTSIGVTAALNTYNQITVLGVNKNTLSNAKLWSVYAQTNQFVVREFVATNNNYYENYALPVPTATAGNINYNILTTKNTRWGTLAASPVAKNSVRSGTISFGYTFPSTPTVVATPFGAGAIADGSVIRYGISNITTSGFDYKIYNSTDNSRNLGLTWIAIG